MLAIGIQVWLVQIQNPKTRNGNSKKPWIGIPPNPNDTKIPSFQFFYEKWYDMIIISCYCFILWKMDWKNSRWTVDGGHWLRLHWVESWILTQCLYFVFWEWIKYQIKSQSDSRFPFQKKKISFQFSMALALANFDGVDRESWIVYCGLWMVSQVKWREKKRKRAEFQILNFKWSFFSLGPMS